MNYKIVVYVPLTHADRIRDAIGNAGGGKVGNYSFCSFSVKGIGRSKPEPGAQPAIGEVGKLQEVEEERIDVICQENVLRGVIAAIKQVHPYEEMVMDVYPLWEDKV